MDVVGRQCPACPVAGHLIPKQVGEDFLYVFKAARFAGRARRRTWAGPSARRVASGLRPPARGDSPPAARHTKKPRAAMIDGGSGASVWSRHRQCLRRGARALWDGDATPTPFIRGKPIRWGLPGQGRSDVGCSTLTGQAPPDPPCADEGRWDGLKGAAGGAGGGAAWVTNRVTTGTDDAGRCRTTADDMARSRGVRPQVTPT